MNRVLVSHIKLGVPLPFNCYDAAGTLLLRSGNVLTSQKQLDYLMERGLFCEPQNSSSVLVSQPVEEIPSMQDRYELLKIKVNTLFDIVSKELKNRIDAYQGSESPPPISNKNMPDVEPNNKPAPLNDKIGGYFLDKVIRAAKEIQTMCAEDGDAALAAIHLDKHEGHYGVFHALQRAMMCELVAANDITTPTERLPVICAALTADLSMFESQHILFTQATPLNEEQRSQIKRHPLDMSKLLQGFGVKDEGWIDAVLYHHERIDGTGYPFGIRGDHIKYVAKLLAIADIYSAMISARAYRDKKLPKAALREVYLLQGNSVDARISMTFVKEFGIFPPGTFVRLRNSEIGVVVKRGQSAKNPLVKCIAGPLGTPIDTPLKRDTTNSDFEIMEMISRDNAAPVNFKQLWS